MPDLQETTQPSEAQQAAALIGLELQAEAPAALPPAALPPAAEIVSPPPESPPAAMVTAPVETPAPLADSAAPAALVPPPDELTSLRDANGYLRQQIEVLIGQITGRGAPEAPPVQPPPPAAAPAPIAALPPTPARVIPISAPPTVSEEEYEAAFQSVEGLNKLLARVHQQAVESATGASQDYFLKTGMQMAERMADHKVQCGFNTLRVLNEYPAITEHSETMNHMLTQIAAKNPAMSLGKMFDMAAQATMQYLRLDSVAGRAAAPGTAAPAERRPAFAGGTGGRAITDRMAELDPKIREILETNQLEDFVR
jgi:hypothetical protein